MTMTRYVLADLPVGVRGFVKEDETGEPVYICQGRVQFDPFGRLKVTQ